MLRFRIRTQGGRAEFEHASGPIEFGRGPKRDDVARHVIPDQSVSRDHLRVEELPGGGVRLENLSRKQPIRLLDNQVLAPGDRCELALPAWLGVGDSIVEIESGQAESLGGDLLATIALPIRPSRPGAAVPVPSLGRSPTPETLAHWFESVIAVQRAAAGSTEFYEQTAGVLVDLIGLDRGLVLLARESGWEVAARKQVRDNVPGREYSVSVLRRVVEQRRTFFRSAAAAPASESLRGLDAVVASPIFDGQDRVVGALYGSRGSDGSGADAGIGPLEAQLVQLLASAVGAGLARREKEAEAAHARIRSEKYQRELDIGRTIQAGFLPDVLPQLAGWEIGSRFEPAREVSGDFFDVFQLSEGQLALVVADVCNKGVGAALFMALFRSLIRAFLQQNMSWGFAGLLGGSSSEPGAGISPNLAALLSDFNALSTVALTNNYVATVHSQAYMFATLFFAVLNTSAGTLTYVNAGHDPPAVLGPRGVKTRLAPTGPVVGIIPDAAYDLKSVTLEPGDMLFCYTDGVTESRSPNGQLFTEKRLLALLEQPAASTGELLERVQAALRTHTAGTDPFDDITMLAVRRTPGPPT
jgi:sigma-B regulation protein RsbU (phosphoserine phosphatase)